MRLTALSEAAAAAKQITDSLKAAKAHRERVFTALNELRMTIDEIELIMSKSTGISRPTWIYCTA